ncbi:unnamed protein product [Knipowitschia caucasica]|uniref:Uncharacterized protein n=1 Tax=Knipowitschia caucasica TaxID=637954 RepID=A0AAV2K5K3_KNICA
MQPTRTQTRPNTKMWAIVARRCRGQDGGMGEAQSRSVMLQHQDPLDSLRNRKCQDQDGNSNFLSTTSSSKDDENRNQIRPRSLVPVGREPPPSSPPFTVLSPRARIPCWSTLEPLPEVEAADDGYGRVPPDGAEEGRLLQEEGEEARLMMQQYEEKQRQKVQKEQEELEEQDEWGGDSGSDSGSMASLQIEGADESAMERWDRVGVGATRSSLEKRRSTSYSLDHDEEQSSDSDGEQGELMDAVWTLRDRERFKAQEMERHQTQLTMYRRLALIRWVRALQSRVQDQQQRLQGSFDLILTHRKELLRAGATVSVATAANATVTAAQA